MCSSESEAELSLAGPVLGTRKRRSGDSSFTASDVIEGQDEMGRFGNSINYPDSEDDFVVEKRKIKSSKMRKPTKLSAYDLSASTESNQGNLMVEVHLKKEETCTDGGGDFKDNNEVERPVTIATPDQFNSSSLDQEEAASQQNGTPV